MTESWCVVLGAALGLVGAVPGLLLSNRARRAKRPTIALGIGATLWSFCFLSFALGMGYLHLGASFLGFSIAAMAAFLGAWAVESWIAWRWMSPWR